MKTLIIDDEPFMLKLLSHLLSQLGIVDVTVHDRADGALALMETEDAGIELVLCDLQMPDIDGIEVVRRLARMGYKGCLVLVSGEDNRILRAAETLARAQQLNVLGVLHKPVSPERLKILLARNIRPGDKAVRAEQHSYSPEELRVAIAGGELCNVYQPKVSLATGAFTGVETLVRWRHPRDGVVFPDQFISLAEENNLIDDLTAAVLTQALRQARLWKDAGLELQVAVNVSMDNLVSLSFPDRIADEVRRSGIAASSLILEITESRLMKDPIVALDILTRMRLKRFVLSIDDFGTGHSSLSQLRDLPFEELKVDRSFVHRAHSNSSLRGILEGSLGMARMIGLKSVGEGVEDRDDWDLLRATGCDLAQGYFIARPMPAPDIPVWIGTWEARRAELGLDAPPT